MGTLISDDLTGTVGMALGTTTVFASGLVIVFAAWYRIERTLTIHSTSALPPAAWSTRR
ncbi:hypothetical protein [Streptomyces sp. NPDC048192]|uniref:hypothetical protein n=1 Tax=Streptomyces sp. NPDC048192 TaxID=3365510 RepID=UPI00372104E7